MILECCAAVREAPVVAAGLKKALQKAMVDKANGLSGQSACKAFGHAEGGDT